MGYDDGKFSLVAREDPNTEELSVEIVKKSNGEIIPYEEPIFIFRARDRLAIPALEAYLSLCKADGCTDYQLGLLEERIEVFEKWNIEHPERMKQPGITEGR